MPMLVTMRPMPRRCSIRVLTWRRAHRRWRGRRRCGGAVTATASAGSFTRASPAQRWSVWTTEGTSIGAVAGGSVGGADTVGGFGLEDHPHAGRPMPSAFSGIAFRRPSRRSGRDRGGPWCSRASTAVRGVPLVRIAPGTSDSPTPASPCPNVTETFEPDVLCLQTVALEDAFLR